MAMDGPMLRTTLASAGEAVMAVASSGRAWREPNLIVRLKVNYGRPLRVRQRVPARHGREHTTLMGGNLGTHWVVRDGGSTMVHT